MRLAAVCSPFHMAAGTEPQYPLKAAGREHQATGRLGTLYTSLGAGVCSVDRKGGVSLELKLHALFPAGIRRALLHVCQQRPLHHEQLDFSR